MRFGVSLWPLRCSQIVDVAMAAERLGYDSVWLGEHIVTPVTLSSQAPLDDDIRRDFHSEMPFHDPFAVLSYVAAKTQTVRLVSSVSVVPLHDPFQLARSVVTIDKLSKGRFTFGIGAGWMREEFEILGKNFERRGKILDESLDIMERLFSLPVTDYRGEMFNVPPVVMEPKPDTLPHPPFIFGGQAPRALERAARRGQGWIATGLLPEEISEPIKHIRRRRTELGLADQPYEFSVLAVGHIGIDLIEAYGRAGVDRIVVRPWQKGRAALAGIEALAGAVGLTK